MTKCEHKRGRPRSGKDRRDQNADNVAAFTSRRNEVGIIPPPKDLVRKERCRLNLEAFGWEYCRMLLRHRASPDIREGLIRDVQQCIVEGGQSATLFARGAGKTTWVDQIAPVWAMLYGHRRYPVVIGATLRAAKQNLKAIKTLLERSDEIAADFPAIVKPIRHLGGISQRAAAQTYKGDKTDIAWGSDRIVLPTLRGDDGQPLDAGCGAIVTVAGIGGAIRGANEAGQRPDMLLIDDPQTRKIAASPVLVAGVLEYIRSDALALAGHDTTIAAFLTITPQKFGDVATAISSSEAYAEWSRKVQPFIKKLPPKWEQLVSLFCEEYARDAAANDFTRPRSTAWYKANARLFADMEVIDAEQFDHTRECDAKHHLLNLRAKLGAQAFDAEIMMTVRDAGSALEINQELVANAINGTPRGVCPAGMTNIFGFCDVNIQAGAGLSWALVAFGPKRTAAVVDYGRYPADGSPLVGKNESNYNRDRIIAAALDNLAKTLARRTFKVDGGGEARLQVLAFDRGWEPDVVMSRVQYLNKAVPLGFRINALLGVPWQRFGMDRLDVAQRGDHIYPAVYNPDKKAAKKGHGVQYLSFCAPYWREIMQSSFLESPLAAGSLSLFGTDAVVHLPFAAEVCAEKLIRKYPVYHWRGTDTAWDWQTTGPEHFCDAITGCFALASWYRCYDATSKPVDAVALGVTDAPAPDGAPPESKLEEPPLPKVKPFLARTVRIHPRFKRGKYRK